MKREKVVLERASVWRGGVGGWGWESAGVGGEGGWHVQTGKGHGRICVDACCWKRSGYLVLPIHPFPPPPTSFLPPPPFCHPSLLVSFFLFFAPSPPLPPNFAVCARFERRDESSTGKRSITREMKLSWEDGQVDTVDAPPVGLVLYFVQGRDGVQADRWVGGGGGTETKPGCMKGDHDIVCVLFCVVRFTRGGEGRGREGERRVGGGGGGGGLILHSL